MKNQSFAKLLNMERLNNSVNGNPNYQLIIDRGDGVPVTVRSSSDSSWCYGINGNWLGHTIAYTTTRSGRINYCKIATVEDVFADPILNSQEGK